MQPGSFFGGGSPNLRHGTNGVFSQHSVEVVLNPSVVLLWVNCKLVCYINPLKGAVVCFLSRAVAVGPAVLSQGGDVGAGSGELAGKH